jgi:hypothetical protein
VVRAGGRIFIAEADAALGAPIAAVAQ